MSKPDEKTGATNPPAEIEKVKRDISGQVLQKVEAFQAAGELTIPKGYSPENALKSAYLILADTKNSAGDCALDYCTKESIGNALLKMVVWGLSPMKKQVDLIMYGNILKCEPEYTGNIVLAKRFGGLKDIRANAVFEGDDFAFEVDPSTGRKKIIKHVQTIENMASKTLKGAYAVMEFNDGTTDLEVMNMDQVRASWNQGGAKGKSPAHNNFPDQMACKTVINRACKLLIRASDDAVLYTKAEDDNGGGDNAVEATVEHKVKTETAAVKKDFGKNVEETNFEEVPEKKEEAPKAEGENKEEGPGF